MSVAPEIAILADASLLIPAQPARGNSGQAGTRPTLGTLARHLRILAASPEQWWGLVRFDPDRSVRIEIGDQPEYGAWLVVIPPGHAGQDCDCDVATVIAGEATDGAPGGAVLRPGSTAVHGGRSAYNHLLCLAQTNNLPKRRVGEVLELVGLTDVARKRTKGFSLGMGQRLGIAGTLLGDPKILMFDEPVNGLDPEGILWIRNLVTALAVEGRNVFVSSHLLSEMEHTADQLIVIGRGQLLADCTMEEFIAR